MMFRTLVFTVALSAAIATTTPAGAQIAEETTVRAAAAVLDSTMAATLSQIPQAMLADAQAVAVIPNVIKGSFVVGARRGRGLLFVKEADGVWHAPVFITLTGGNIGWQIGVQSSDILLVFKSKRSVDGVLAGKLTIGADAAAAAGPLGRQGGIATDARLEAEIYSYSRSRGLFAGVSIDGSVLRMDPVATGSYYGQAVPGQPMVVPEPARRLTQAIAAYVGSAGSTASAVPLASDSLPPGDAVYQQNVGIPQRYAASEADVLREQLSQLAPQLYDLLDPQWAQYLALPSGLFLESAHPSAVELEQTVNRFDRVANDPQFRELAARPEFQSVHGVLKHYQQSLGARGDQLRLPPPPTGR